ncbi:MAG: hypothetical protein JXR58_10715 [Bacteroidales bacterium]|nr:hypothetical protein [Bacteroidales bacterium]
MELVIKINKNTKESEISKITKFLKLQNCVKKLDIISDDINMVSKVLDKETVYSIHKTSSKALKAFLEKENESIF